MPDIDNTTPAAPVENDESLQMEMVVTIVAAYLSNNQVEATTIPALIQNIAQSVTGLSQFGSTTSATPSAPQEPFVSIKKSITPDYLISLEDGRRLKSLKRYLRTKYNLTPDEYRAKWGLPSDYPMVAPNYAKARSALAKQMGLGLGGSGRPAKKTATPVKVSAKSAAA